MIPYLKVFQLKVVFIQGNIVIEMLDNGADIDNRVQIVNCSGNLYVEIFLSCRKNFLH